MEATRKTSKPTPRGFSLIELVIVVVIIGIIGAIAVPRMSRGAKGAADSALIANLTVLRNGLDLYATEHVGSFPAFANMPGALLSYTDSAGAVAAKDTTHIYGPYIRAIPTLPVGTDKGSNTFTNTAPGIGATASFGWYYNVTAGEIKANVKDAETDEAGKPYNTY